MKTTTSILIAAILCCSCIFISENKDKELADRYVDRIETLPNQNGFQKIYEGKELVAVGHLADGKKEGFWKFYKDENLMAEGHLSRDIKSGFWKTYYSNGQVKEEGHYDNGKKYGYWKYYKPNGKATEKNH